jgi:hypothetical protein
MKQFDCTLEKMARFGSDKDGWTLDPDCNVEIWNKRIKATGINKALKILASQHKVMNLTKSFEKINPNYIRCYVSTNSNYYNDITGFDLKEEDEKTLGIGMVLVHIYEVKFDVDGEPIHNHGYEKCEDWY